MSDKTTVIFNYGSEGGSNAEPGGLPKTIGKYEVIKLLGRGGMGSVYLGKDPDLGRFVAIKTLLPFTALTSADTRKELLHRFLREAKSIAQLNHPNIVNIYGIGRTENALYLAMEFLDGDTLSYLSRNSLSLPLVTKLQDMVQMCEGLNAIHEAGFVHRDIKPGNIMKTRDGVIKIMDFGTVHTTDSDLTQEEQLLGTPSYMSPEQLRYVAMDKRSDIFSLGAVFYFYLTGEKPFPGESFSAVSYKIMHEVPPLPSKLNPLLPKGLDRVVMKALEKSPDERYASCKELAEALKTALDKSAEPKAETAASRYFNPVLASVLALLLLGAAVFFWGPKDYRLGLENLLGIAPASGPSEETSSPEPRPKVSNAKPLAFQLNYLHLPLGEAGFRRLRNAELLKKDDTYKIVFTPDEDCYVFIVRIDRGLGVVRLFPADEARPQPEYTNPVKQGKTYILPEPDKPYSLSQTTGQQELFFLATRTLDTTLASYLKIIENSTRQKDEKLLAIYRFKTRMLLKRVQVPDAGASTSMTMRWTSGGPESSFVQQRLENLCDTCVHRLEFTVQ